MPYETRRADRNRTQHGLQRCITKEQCRIVAPQQSAPRESFVSRSDSKKYRHEEGRSCLYTPITLLTRIWAIPWLQCAGMSPDSMGPESRKTFRNRLLGPTNYLNPIIELASFLFSSLRELGSTWVD